MTFRRESAGATGVTTIVDAGLGDQEGAERARDAKAAR